jgi:pyruvate/2-oxoglutarate dehydrogenase complex dihydrolipoamide dehydrogenase (E3) component
LLPRRELPPLTPPILPQVPTAVFTPTEYGACGLSEEDAITMFGKEDVEVYLQEFTTLELQVKTMSCCLGQSL